MQIPNLNIGDEIGFVRLAGHVDESDAVIFYPVALIAERDGERAYRFMFPDGIISGAAIRQSELKSHLVKIQPAAAREPATADGAMLDLKTRPAEFREALERGKEENLEIFEDWDKDSFVVVNHANHTEYRIAFEETRASCDCQDFKYRRRICKHIAAVMIERWFTVKI